MVKLAAKILVNLVLRKSALTISLAAAAIALAAFMITITIISPINLVQNVVFAEQTTTTTPTQKIQQPLPDDLQKYFDEKIVFGSHLYVDVYYQSSETIVLRGDALDPKATPLVGNVKLWRAVELLKHDFEYKLDKFVVNGISSEVNPERFYVIMTK
jgi:hypothetical protein